MEQLVAIQERLLDGLQILAHVLAKTLHLPAPLPWFAADQHEASPSQIQLVTLHGRERGEQPYPDPEYLREEACKPWVPAAPGSPREPSASVASSTLGVGVHLRPPTLTLNAIG
eukprot:jgi/Botrbrau1/22421/Bobra.0091s0024.1